MEPIESRFRSAASRCLGFIDRNPISVTAGCADRNYWHYQDGKGFAVGSFQVVMFGLKMASSAFPENASAYSSAADLAAGWWATQINQHTFLDEYFVKQKSFCATAYTTLAAASWLSSGPNNENIQSGVRQAISTALGALAEDQSRPDSANQSIAARLAFDLAAERGLVYGDSPFAPRALGKMGFSEYGGFDLGYSLKCLDLCALALLTLKNPARKGAYAQYTLSILRSLHILCVQFTFSPYLSSRGNPHSLLGGLTHFARSGNNTAIDVLDSLSNSKRFPSLVRSECCDDKYLAFFHLNSLMLEFANNTPLHYFSGSTKLIADPPPRFEDGLHTIPELDLLLYKAKSTRAAVALGRGGSVQVESADKIQTDLGRMFVRSKKIWVNANQLVSPEIRDLGNLDFSISLSLKVVRLRQRTQLIQNWWFSFALKLVLSLPLIGQWLRGRLYHKVNARKTSWDIGQRKIEFSANGVTIKDTINPDFDHRFEVCEWIFNDGHATRLFQFPKPAISIEGLDAT